MNSRPLYPILSRPPRPHYRQRTGAYRLLSDLCKGGQLNPKRLPIYKKIADLTRDGGAHFVSNRSIARFTFEDFGLLRCENTVANAKADLVKARLLNLVRGKNAKKGRNIVRRPANEIQASGLLARRFGWRVGFLPGAILQRRPFSTLIPATVIHYLEVLRETRTRRKLGYTMLDSTARAGVTLGAQNKTKKPILKINGKKPVPFSGLLQKPEKISETLARLRSKWLPKLFKNANLRPDLWRPEPEKEEINVEIQKIPVDKQPDAERRPQKHERKPDYFDS